MIRPRPFEKQGKIIKRHMSQFQNLPLVEGCG
jgi:hypothetical protein